MLVGQWLAQYRSEMLGRLELGGVRGQELEPDPLGDDEIGSVMSGLCAMIRPGGSAAPLVQAYLVAQVTGAVSIAGLLYIVPVSLVLPLYRLRVQRRGLAVAP